MVGYLTAHSICAVTLVAAAVAGQNHPAASEQASETAAAPTGGEISLDNWLVIGTVGRYGRAAVHTDAIEAQIVAGRWSLPKAGDTVTLPDGTKQTWQTTAPGEDGMLKDDALRRGYACATVEVDAPRIVVLEASGPGRVYVNGEPRAGDPYGTGWGRLPVQLQAGMNTFLFHGCGRRGGLVAKLVEPVADLTFNTRDVTLPDFIVGEPVDTWGAVVVINAGTTPVSDLQLKASYPGGRTTLTPVPIIAAMSVRKVGFQLSGPAPKEPGEVKAQVEMVLPDRRGVRTDKATLTVEVRDPNSRRKRTFLSEIDGSVQYYAVTPAQPPPERDLSACGHTQADTPRPALFLTLHGAGVEAAGQARAYQAKDWGHVVAATNRRPFGFDWEDWGRLDAMEVLELAAARLNTDPLRTYLTGHSMGGHGVWHVGVTFPDRFAAIAPSAAWISFWSYTGAAQYEETSPVEGILRRATSCSDTLALSRNYLHYGVYILHGESDDNVPVEQARTMREHLAQYHADFAYYERPGAKHWWSSACVDWPPLFGFLKHHVKPAPETVRQVEFVTANPAVSATSHWVTIEAQIHPLEFSSVKLSFDPKERKFTGTTENVARLLLDLTELSRPRQDEKNGEQVDATVLPAGEPLTIELDGQTLEKIEWPKSEPRIRLTRANQAWSMSEKPPSPRLKGPHRYGPFKQVFRHNFVFVYGTQGTVEENQWSRAKTRYDAETFWYRGNGAVDVVADTAFVADRFAATADRNRNVILYGNAETNAAWKLLLGDSPVQVRAGFVTIGDRKIEGDDLACLAIRPRPGSDRALVGVVGGTGAAGMRLTDRLPYFVSGVAYPDCIVMGPDILTEGVDGVRVAGFFGIDWGVESGEFAWRDELDR